MWVHTCQFIETSESTNINNYPKFNFCIDNSRIRIQLDLMKQMYNMHGVKEAIVYASII